MCKFSLLGKAMFSWNESMKYTWKRKSASTGFLINLHRDSSLSSPFSPHVLGRPRWLHPNLVAYVRETQNLNFEYFNGRNRFFVFVGVIVILWNFGHVFISGFPVFYRKFESLKRCFTCWPSQTQPRKRPQQLDEVQGSKEQWLSRSLSRTNDMTVTWWVCPGSTTLSKVNLMLGRGFNRLVKKGKGDTWYPMSSCFFMRNSLEHRKWIRYKYISSIWWLLFLLRASDT